MHVTRLFCPPLKSLPVGVRVPTLPPMRWLCQPWSLQRRTVLVRR
jgi:hypothetical protein